MHGEPLTDRDRELVETAAETIARRYRPGTEARSRSVGAALRADSGRVYTGVNLVADVGRANVCAEPIAVGAAVTAGDESFDTIVAVKYAPAADPRTVDPGDGSSAGDAPVDAATTDADPEPSDYRVIAACGVCRELIRDYDPTTQVILPGADSPYKRPARKLLPDLDWRGPGGDDT